MKTTSKERIRIALERSGKNLSQLAKKLNRAQPSVSERLLGEGEIDSVIFIRGVAELTGFPFMWLLNGEETEDAKNETTPVANPRDHIVSNTQAVMEEDKMQMLISSMKRTIELLEKDNRRLEKENDEFRKRIN